MGRHSAQAEDETEDRSAVAVADGATPTPAGRHARPEAEDASGTRPAGPRGRLAPRPFGAPAGTSTAGPVSPTAGAVPPAAGAEDATVRIPMVTDPIADQPIPQKVTQQIPVVLAPVLDEPVGSEPATPPSPSPSRGAQYATSADLALVLGNRRVLAGAVVAVLLPFVAYVVVLAVTDNLVLRTSLIWIWAPLITAGLLLGLVLDAGHRRSGSGAPQSDAPQSDAPQSDAEPALAPTGATEPSDRP